jgi:hypothetical protein
MSSLSQELFSLDDDSELTDDEDVPPVSDSCPSSSAEDGGSDDDIPSPPVSDDAAYYDVEDGDYKGVKTSSQSSRKSSGARGGQHFKYRSSCSCELTKDGLDLLEATEEGKAVLKKCQDKEAYRNGEPMSFTSPDIADFLVKNCDSALLFPIRPKDNKVVLNFYFTFLFPKEREATAHHIEWKATLFDHIQQVAY